MAFAQNYKAEQATDHGIAVVRLSDAQNRVEVSIVPSGGNIAYEMSVNGQNILYFPYSDVSEYLKKPALSGIPFLAPWANRLDQTAFWANGIKYEFNMGLGNVHGPIPIHGLLSSSSYWQVTEVKADDKSAHVTSRLDFYKYPELMAQWPIAHSYEMTYRLSEGVLEVQTTVSNLSAQPMPVSIGFHPYFRIPGIHRDDWVGRIPARKRVITDNRLIPTGQYKPMDLDDPLLLEGRTLDDGFTDLIREDDGRAHFSILSNGKQVEVMFGPKYQAAVVWEPKTADGKPQDFICFEPMAGITDAVNLFHQGKYPELQSVAPGGAWTESFWIRTSGF